MNRALIRVLAALVLVIGAVGLAAPAQASGGGCYTPASQNGWNIGVCTSDDGVYVYGDFYINTVGTGSGSSCHSYLDIWDATADMNLTGNDWKGCAPGHHTWSSVGTGKVKMHAGHKYYAWVDIVWNGWTAFSARNNSKPTVCC
jgi:hypothetical protein